jgi:hypothetical protein
MSLKVRIKVAGQSGLVATGELHLDLKVSTLLTLTMRTITDEYA